MMLLQCVLLAVMSVSSVHCQNLGVYMETGIVTEANNVFCLKLYKAMSGLWGNLAISPLGVTSLLTAALVGARGRTSLQISRVLAVSLDNRYVEDEYRNVLKYIEDTSNGSVVVSNKVFIQRGYEVKEEFQRKVSTFYNTQTETVDFARDFVSTTNSIAEWAKNVTSVPIKQLSEINQRSVLVFACAMHFKGLLIKDTSRLSKSLEPFYISPTSVVYVPMMRRTTALHVGRSTDGYLSFLRIYFNENKLAMVFAVATGSGPMRRLENNLPKFAFREMLATLQVSLVNIYLPCFKVHTSMDLTETLSEMGMADMFSPMANFSGLTDKRVRSVSLLQTGVVELTEEEDADYDAAPHDLWMDREMVDIEIKLNRPFLFFVLDPSDKIVFMGRVQNPLE